MHQTLSLYELNGRVREAIETGMDGEYWVEAELSDIHERGHCYMELIQKDERSRTPVAKARATCWANRWLLVRSYFERVTGQELHAGMKVLLQVRATFHEAYGFAYNVTDIDPTFTLGDMARRRQEIINQLKEEGVFELQKELQIPLFAQRIAVISSETAAGYGDFCNQLANNEYGFAFTTRLFPAVMQGERVEASVIAALDRIFEVEDQFDVVVIIRGGGATSDMSGFDTLALAENVANFPLPVITGIGHDRDESVLDLIANTRVKTPTAAAAFLIDHLAVVYTRIVKAQEAVVDSVRHKMEVEKLRLGRLEDKIPVAFSVVRTRQEARLEQLRLQLIAGMRGKLAAERHRGALLAQRVAAADPEKLLGRGYSITLYKGRVLHDAHSVQPGEEIETKLQKGSVKSIIK
ncbi:exodeoxyribonuclease VII large subunit [Prevotella sp. kh1p2]|uniref:exodeoxyribonuclease VII large subunit n=1 Tax=Prevotella sp. kh1p2 TaxID=1761883 RepID=UPI0008BCC9AC|nr:exodeoxyribonuclease VII large subunit [Prevotella sp. kh1p2]SES73853.1 exodeoxyribonuclease VII large subunit [Prevotella sp. kh1p2]SNU10591.1 Exodeoxyribonuclease VII large subunit [Prevotellaceae bacterium KH2P17]